MKNKVKKVLEYKELPQEILDDMKANLDVNGCSVDWNDPLSVADKLMVLEFKYDDLYLSVEAYLNACKEMKGDLYQLHLLSDNFEKHKGMK